MSNKVHILTVHTGETAAPNEDIITVCRELLKDAKSGKIQGIGVALAVHEPLSGEHMTSTMSIRKFAPGYYYATRTAIDNMQFRGKLDAYNDGGNTNGPELTEDDE